MKRPAADTPKAFLENIARNLKSHRRRLGLSQEQFADLCGYHRTYIGSIERAERNITIQTLCNVAATLHISILDLLEDSHDSYR